VTNHRLSQAVATDHDRPAAPLVEWAPRRPERPDNAKALWKPLRVVSAYQPAGDPPTAIAALTAVQPFRRAKL